MQLLMECNDFYQTNENKQWKHKDLVPFYSRFLSTEQFSKKWLGDNAATQGLHQDTLRLAPRMPRSPDLTCLPWACRSPTVG